MQIRKAIQQDNYHRFFRLYRVTPNMGNYVLDLMIDTWRIQALQRIVKAYKPSVSAEFVVNELAFAEEQEGLDFLRKVGCILEAPATASAAAAAVSQAASPGKKKAKTSVPAVVDASTLEINTKESVVDVGAVFTQEKLLL